MSTVVKVYPIFDTRGLRINSTVGNGGGLGNQIIRNLCSSIVAQKNNLKFTYSRVLSNDGASLCHPIFMEDLGIELFKDGKMYYDHYIELNEELFQRVVEGGSSVPYNIFTDFFYQTPFIAKYLREYLCDSLRKIRIIKKNPFKSRYDKNNDVFIHLRIKGAAWDYFPDYPFVDLALSHLYRLTLTPRGWFNSGYGKIYLATDQFDHPVCIKLCRKYDMIPVEADEIKTIQFGSTCRHIILSNGTFGWVTGVLGFFSRVYHPNMKLKPQHHGDIFVFDDWSVIEPGTPRRRPRATISIPR